MHVTPPSSTIHRLVGWVLVCVYLAAIPGLAPASLVAVAALHGGHDVSITAAHGDWDVVLHHDDDAHAEGHEHSPHSGRGADLADGDHHHGPDHVFHFSAASHASTPAACSLQAVSPVSLISETISAPEHPACRVPDYPDTVFASPPPGRPALLVCLRTTVLIV